MKKLLLAAVCALTLIAVACSSSPEKQAEKLIDKYTAKVENAQSIGEMMGIVSDLVGETQKLAQKYPDFKGSESLARRAEKLESAIEKKMKQLTPGGYSDFGNFDLDGLDVDAFDFDELDLSSLNLDSYDFDGLDLNSLDLDDFDF